MSLLRTAIKSSSLSRFFTPTTSFRSFNSSTSNLTATPDWQTTIGGRAGILTAQKAFTNKYQLALEKKAKADGITVEELLKRKSEEIKLNDELKRKERAALIDGVVEAGGIADEVEGRVVRPLPSAVEEKEAKAKRERNQDSSPIKPLNSILDLSKASTLSTSAISHLWTSYHQSKGYLSAAIPKDTYERMLVIAKKYPLFVLPLARDVIGEVPEGMQKEGGAVEMHLLEWAFLPPPTSALEPIPSPSTVLFTPLAEYQSRQSYAQPYLILTHYTDLSNSHNLVLMRGEISDNVSLNAVDAQVLTVRLQLFYNYTGLGGEREKGRMELLECFHEKPEDFQLEKLVATANEL